VPALIHTAGWLLMIVAMMLPTTLPLLNRFARIISGRADANRLLSLTIAGYVIAWTAFGVVAHGADWLVHLAVAAIPSLAIHAWILGSALIAAAGLFQFTALKHRCLEQCRTPMSYIMSHWHGKSPAREALALGLHHGAFCIGCCWALMLLMFVVGTASIGWMLVLGGVMAMEKNLPWGRRLSTPLGVGLLAIAGATVAANL
jgi:predicted metal-binding membrane protein